MLVVLPHVIVSSAALVGVRVIVVAMLAALSKIVLGVRNAVTTGTSVCAVLGVMRITHVLIVGTVALLVSLDVLTILL
jgi:hypothetical protein